MWGVTLLVRIQGGHESVGLEMCVEFKLVTDSKKKKNHSLQCLQIN